MLHRWAKTAKCNMGISRRCAYALDIAVSIRFWYFEVKGGMETKLLSPKTIYGTYLVFKFHDLERRILYKEDPPVKCGVYFEGKDDGKRHSLFLDPAGSMLRRYRDKGDGWMEIEMGEFFNENGHDGMLMFTSSHDSDNTRNPFIIEGIELRPKYAR
ncbi:hypothetical protein Patl1_25939 [Pistacia atlantica]|uniref:Uncharacterized protein n=1 Tax=Pistacia atlantica TaxID=434234 RepID=A0ACC1B013_9ROSI|nr:hypothetical protein Patl1_25939 [Pistacia atlantica]